MSVCFTLRTHVVFCKVHFEKVAAFTQDCNFNVLRVMHKSTLEQNTQRQSSLNMVRGNNMVIKEFCRRFFSSEGEKGQELKQQMGLDGSVSGCVKRGRVGEKETPWAQPTFLIWWSIITLCGFTSRCMIPIL